MLLALLSAVTLGGFCTTIALWFGRYGVAAAGVSADARLSRLRDGPDIRPTATAGGGADTVALRQRVRSINFGGIQLVSGNVIERWTDDLERAGLTLNVREYLTLRIAIGIALGALAVLVVPTAALFVFPVGAILGFIAPGYWVSFRKGRRKKQIEGQLAEFLSMMAGALRAGFGLLQSIESSLEQLPEPLAYEVRRMLRDTAVGASVEQALEGMNKRLGSPDFDMVVMAIQIQRNVGGNLAEILDTVSHTIRERDRIRGEIRTLTAQGRLTGLLLGAIPWGLFGMFWLINPDYVSLLFTDPLGRGMLFGGLVLWVLGFITIQRIVNIDI